MKRYKFLKDDLTDTRPLVCMLNLFRQTFAVFWITAIILAWWFLQAYSRYEIPVSNSKVVLTGDTRTLFVATRERPTQ